MCSSDLPPAIVLLIGAGLATAGVQTQRSLPLRAPLSSTLPESLDAWSRSQDIELSAQEIEVAGVTTYLSRVFVHPDSATAPIYLYVGYYDRQTRGKTIHSPRNCLPGSGWEPLTNTAATIVTPDGPVVVNRYLIQKGRDQALVLYWYQGRGRVASNEYAVKWDLVRDAALSRRSEEALVRVVVPVTETEASAFDVASRVAGRIVTSLRVALPA